MAVDSKHPLYSEFLSDWQTMEDTSRGERVVKSKGTTYLPATSGMLANGGDLRTGTLTPNTPGWFAYQAYLKRAVFPDFVKEAIEKLLGVMHHKAPDIKLPASMEPMLERATVKGESLQVLLRRINEAQLKTGRLGLLLDLPATPVQGAVTPHIAVYNAQSIINWDDGKREELVNQKLNFVSLAESEYERDSDFEWKFVEKYRVLVLGDPLKNEPSGAYTVGLYRREAGSGDNTTGTEQPGAAASGLFNREVQVTPAIAGRTLDKIPFVFVNSTDVVPEPTDPPLIGLANLALTVYRTEADYRQSLFMQGQDTLVVIGANDDGDAPIKVGANAQIKLPTGGDAKYIGVSSNGLPELRQALENDRKTASQKGGMLVDNTSREKESGEALKTRVGAQTASLNQIALTGAYALEQLLKIAAEWMGANPDEVEVKPNLDFEGALLTGEELSQWMAAKNLGAPIARTTIHDLMRARGVTEKTYEDELAEIEEEEPLTVGFAPALDPNKVPPEDEPGNSEE